MADKGLQTPVKLLALGRDPPGLLRHPVLLPAEGHRLEHRQEGHRRGHQDLLADGVFEQIGVLVESRPQTSLIGNEHYHEIRGRVELIPVFLPSELPDPAPHRPDMPAQHLPPIPVIIGFHGGKVGGQGDLGVHRQHARVGQMN